MRLKLLLCAVFSAWQALAAGALAADASELWPELSAFVALRPDARLYLDASYTRDKPTDSKALDLSAVIDLSIKPILREELGTEDWQRSRYLWARLGYTHVANADGGTPAAAENRGVLSIYAKAPLPAEVWVEARTRVDLRWIGDAYSTRYRFRLEASREFMLYERSIAPYFNVEWFYDTRYNGWARTLYQGGVEVPVSKRLRYEIYLARQNDRRPSEATLNALGLVAKWYY